MLSKIWPLKHVRIGFQGSGLENWGEPTPLVPIRG